MTLFFTSDQITIYRMRRRGSTHTFGMSATYTVYDADIQPATDERIKLENGRFGAVYSAFVDESVSIKENDQIVSSGKRYSVRGVQTYTGVDSLAPHKELLLVSEDG